MHANRPIVAGIVLLALALGAMSCATADPPIAQPPSSAAGDETSGPAGTDLAGDDVVERQPDFTSFRTDGEMTTEKALQVFALAFGPLPGVEAPTDPALAFPGGTQTGVILDILERLDDLTVEQRQAVADYLVPDGLDAMDASSPDGSVGEGTDPDPTTATTAEPAAEPAAGPEARPASYFAPAGEATHDPVVDAMIVRAVSEIQARTGSTLDPEIETDFTGTAVVDSEGSWAVAEAYLRRLLAPDWPAQSYEQLSGTKCRIHIGTNVTNGGGEPAYSSVAHEVFHCFQYRSFYGSGDEFLARPSWVTEGGAAWVGEELAGGSGIALAQSWWRYYLQGADDGTYPMFDNEGYVAIGFWEYLDTAGADPWHKVLEAVQAIDDGTAFSLVTGNSRPLLAAWASSTARKDWAPDGRWRLNVTNQRPTDDHRSPSSGTIPHGDMAVVARPGQQVLTRLAPAEGVEFAIVELSSPVTISWVFGGPGESTASMTGTKVYCLLDDCVCPDGTLPFDGGFTQIGGGKSLVVGLNGSGTFEGRTKIAGASKEDVCQPCPGSDQGSAGQPMAAPRFAPSQGDSGSCPDPCPTGKWNLDTADLASQAGAVLAPAQVTIEGGVVLDLDGTRSVVTYSDQMVSVRPMDSGLVMTLRFAWAGTATGTYTAVMGTFTATEEANDVHATITGDINGSPMPTTGMGFPGGGSVFGGAATYQCDGGTMVTQSAGSPFHHTWHRINAPG
jgi:hypothetical protein